MSKRTRGFEQWDTVGYFNPHHSGAKSALPLWNGEAWQLFHELEIPDKGRKKVILKPQDVESLYVARSPFAPEDILLGIVDLFCQLYARDESSTAEVSRFTSNIVTLAAHLDLLRSLESGEGGRRASFHVETVVNSVINALRSLYDTFQEIVRGWWDIAVLNDAQLQRKRRRSKGQEPIRLPKTFSSMVLKGQGKEAPKQPEEMVDAYVLPHEIARAFAAGTPAFTIIRDLRVRNEHGGGNSLRVGVAEHQLFCMVNVKPFSFFPELWRDCSSPTSSLWTWIDHLASEALHSLHNIVVAFTTLFHFDGGPAYLEGYRVYIRYPVTPELTRIVGPWNTPIAAQFTERYLAHAATASAKIPT